MIEMKLSSNTEDLELISKQIIEAEKVFYMQKLEYEILNIANIIKTEEQLKDLSKISFSLERDEGKYYLSVYPYDANDEEIEDFYFQEVIGLSSGDYDYLINMIGINFNFSIDINKDTNLILELAKNMMYKNLGELWYKEKLSKELYENLQEEIPLKTTVKKHKV